MATCKNHRAVKLQGDGRLHEAQEHRVQGLQIDCREQLQVAITIEQRAEE